MRIEHEALLEAEEKMEKTVSVLREDYINIRAGRANPQILNKVMVDYYGVMTPITQMANVAAPEARLITITLWDASTLKAVEKAILASDLGLNPSNDGKVIRLVLPTLTAERRKELVKQVKKKAEDSKVAIRSIRRDAVETLRKEKKNSEITEDDLTILEEDVQKIHDDFIKKIDKVCAEKEAEILEI
ncbi:MAG: ribosome recycling factor [Clostridiales bacterium]|nr:ribosome recycling factor [Clostridiales bacterium]MBP3940777.1 ribosome recycling factor [Christensenellaceae bacterium]MBR3842675.1 ribosome recycling factor [Christensenellaceae bacterium]